MEGFDEVPKSLFERCTEQMMQNEIIYNKNFDTKSAMSSLEVSGKRLDSHFIANGHHSISDSISSGTPAPMESLSDDELCGICGKFIDLQVSRINGYEAYTNILTSVYIMKNCEIKNPILKFMFKCFSSTSYQIEDFAFKLQIGNSSWRYNLGYMNALEKYDFDELEKELNELKLPEVLKKLALFEINFGKFLDNPFEHELNQEVVVPEQTNNLGIDMYLKYRDSPPANAPTKPHIYPHEESIEILNRFVKEIAEVKKLFANEMMLSDLISTIQKWNEECDHVSLARFITYYLILEKTEPTKYFNKVTPEQYLKNELKAYHIHQKFFENQKYSELVSYFNIVLVTLVQKLVSPIPTCHLSLSDTCSHIWCFMQYKGFELQTEALKPTDFPRCSSKEQQMIASNVYPLWSSHIASQLLMIIFRWGYLSDLYSDKDMHIIMYCFEIASKTSKVSLSQYRVADAVYRTVNNTHKNSIRNEKDVNRKIKEKTIEELYYEILDDYYNGMFNMFKLVNYWNCFEVKRGNYFNEEKIFENRVYPINKMAHFSKLEYKEFKKSFDFEYKGYEQIFKQEITRYFTKAINGIKSYRAIKGSLNEELSIIFRSSISNNLALAKLTDKSKVKLIKPPTQPYPYFEIISTNE